MTTSGRRPRSTRSTGSSSTSASWDAASRERAVLLVCFLYDNPGFQVLESTKHNQVKAQVTTALQQGVEIWEVDFQLDATGVRVLHHHELTQQFGT